MRTYYKFTECNLPLWEKAGVARDELEVRHDRQGTCAVLMSERPLSAVESTLQFMGRL